MKGGTTMDKELVKDVFCEKIVVGTLITYPDEYRNQGVGEILTEEMFYHPKYAFIFQTIRKMNEDCEKIDLLTVYNKIAQSNNDIGYEDIMDAAEQVVTSVTLKEHCGRVASLWQRRRLMEIGAKLMKAGTSELGDTEQVKANAVDDIKSLDVIHPPKIQSNFEVARDINQLITDNLAQQTLGNIPTGFPEIDENGGICPTDLVIIAAYSSQGKSSLALDICLNAARHNHVCVFYSLEMQSIQLMARMLSAETGVSSAKILRSPLSGEDLKMVDVGLGKVENLPIYYDDTATLSFERILSSIRFLHRKKNLRVAFIDYLQILQNNDRRKNQTEEQFFGMVTRMLKNLAKELDICIILLSQISRSADCSVEPSLSRIRGSGQIVEAADVVILIYRPEAYDKDYSGKFENYNTHGTALIKIAKGRNIGTSEFLCRFDEARTHFSPIDSVIDYQRKTNDIVIGKPPF